MEKLDIEALRCRVPCAAVLERAGFAVDAKESTRRAVKYRRGTEIIIAIHDGRGWFDPLSDAKGDVFSLATHLEGRPFAEVLATVAGLVGFAPRRPIWRSVARQTTGSLLIPERWRARRRPSPTSMTWRYLEDERCLPAAILSAALRQDLLREGPEGSMWAAHTDEGGTVTGWEARGTAWRGFSAGGSKRLFRFGPSDATRLCVTEAAIDAMSLAALEGPRPGSLYLSTGGGWSPIAEDAMRTLACRQDVQIVAATDGNGQGEAFAERLRGIADAADRDWLRLKPAAEDWNEVLQRRSAEARERRTARARR